MKFLKCLPLIAIMSTSALARADDQLDQSGYLGVLLGGNRTSNSDGKFSDSNTTGTLGLTVGAKLLPNFGLGLFGSYFGQTNSGSFLGLPVGTSASTLMLLGQANVFIRWLHFGAELGTAVCSWSGNVSSLYTGSSTNSLVYGPEAGFDFKIDKAISAGGELHYLFSNEKNVDNNIQALASLKLWL